MDQKEATELVEGLRAAAAVGGAVVELTGDEARGFKHLRDPSFRRVLLGSFRVGATRDFFVCVVSTPRSDDQFQMFVFSSRSGVPQMVANEATADGVIWRYQPAKRSGDNQRRKQAFIQLAGSEEISFPRPAADITAFSDAVARALGFREKADADGGGDGDEIEPGELLEDLFRDLTDRQVAVRALATTIETAHALNPRGWCVTHPQKRLIRVNVGSVWALDLTPGMITRAVIVSALGPDAHVTLGAGLEMSSADTPVWRDTGAIRVAPAEIVALPPDVEAAHRAYIARAARAVTQFARHHEPAIVDAASELFGAPLPQPASVGPQYWKLTAGDDGEHWPAFRTGGYVALAGAQLGDLVKISREDLSAAAAGTSDDELASLWSLRDMVPGDRVVLAAGTRRVLALGTISQPYYFVAGDPLPHRLGVEWDDLAPREVEMNGWRPPVVRLTAAIFGEVQGAARAPSVRPEPPEAGPLGGINFDGILAHLRNASLTFPAELVASYLLALQARRFVLLTGISGTGKTQLALELARVYSSAVATSTAEAEAVRIVVSRDTVKRARLSLPVDFARLFDVLEDDGQRRLAVRVPGRPAESMSVYKAPDRPGLLQVLLSGEAKAWLLEHTEQGECLVLRREESRDGEVLVVEHDGDAQVPVAADSSYESVAVRPDWTDSRALLGFYNPLTRSYVSTRTLQLLLRAQAEVKAARDGRPPRPYFLIFDEMNLARVEHYFADFLSAMESGEPIDLHDEDELADTAGIPKQVVIPRNVFVIGTVNVDETTYMFSPKVLDRAFVLEFNEVDLDGLGRPAPAVSSRATPLALVNLGDGLRLLDKPVDAEWVAFEEVAGGGPARLLRRIHAALVPVHRHFGYRVAREIARFVTLASEQTDGSEAALWAALDVAVLAKVLPKLHGTQADLETTLDQLHAIAAGVGAPAPAGTDGPVATPPPRLPRTAAKLERMRARMRSLGFTSFIE